MHRTVDLLLKGDPAVLDNYRRAVEHWREIWARPEVGHIYDFADLVSDEVQWFDRNCGGEDLGQEIMVISGFGMLYSPDKGFEDRKDKAHSLYRAFQLSDFPVELRVLSRDLATSYQLIGEGAA